MVGSIKDKMDIGILRYKRKPVVFSDRVPFFCHFYADTRTSETGCRVKCQTAETTSVIEKNIFLRERKGIEKNLQHTVWRRFVAMAVVSVQSVFLNFFRMYL